MVMDEVSDCPPFRGRWLLIGIAERDEGDEFINEKQTVGRSGKFI
jgi:hypothetical protein